MNVGELRKALEGYRDETPVKLRAYCCPHNHAVKVDYAFESELSPGVLDPDSLVVLILDESIRVYDRPEDKPSLLDPRD